MREHKFCTGIQTLIESHPDWLKHRGIGLVSHQAAVDAKGISSLDHVVRTCGKRLKALFGPEHGFGAGAAPGALIRRQTHPDLGIPVFSLYGKHRHPTAAMLKGIDLILIEFQDLGARMYTYLTTMLNVMDVAARQGLTVVVADRPIPLPCVVDGPMLDPSWRSFVGAAPLPMSYGMTPAETALWFKRQQGLDLDLRVAKMCGYRRDAFRGADWPEWIPPSPAIRTWESAQCYGATVFCEGLRSVDCGRNTNLAFRVFGASWMRSRPVIERLRKYRLAGVVFHPHRYEAVDGKHRDQRLDGIRMTVTDPHTFRPIRVSVAIIRTLQELYGDRRVWKDADNRLQGFDRLYGTHRVRERVRAGTSVSTITREWAVQCADFEQSRETCLLYPAVKA